MNVMMVSNYPYRLLIDCYSVNMKKMPETVGLRHLFFETERLFLGHLCKLVRSNF